jgi:hypothetical protein
MIPVVQIIHKSWDFMPTDVVRPMASSTVSDIAVMARRLGMVWKTFDPGSGSMRAEGNGHVITSTMVRSLGTVLQYSFTSRKNAGNCIYIPVREADKLGFGLVEFDHRLFGPEMPRDLDVGSYQGIASTLSLVMGTGLSHSSPVGIEFPLRLIFNAMKSENDFIPGLNDLVPLCSAMLSTSPSTAKDRWQSRIPAPNLYLKGVTSSKEAFQVFETRLQYHVDERSDRASEHSKHVLSCLRTLPEHFRLRLENEQEWEHWDYRLEDSHDDELRTKRLVIQYHTDMTSFLQNGRVIYRHLVGEHMMMAICAQAAKLGVRSESDLDKPDHGLGSDMDNYFGSLGDMVLKVIEKCNYWRPDVKLGVEEVEDAWFSMMFRAFCWQGSHSMIPGVPPLPSEYWNSKMPVYIG